MASERPNSNLSTCSTACVAATSSDSSSSSQYPQHDSPFFDNIAPVSVDIGGSFTKLVYWRPPDPPDLPSYIIKEFQNGEPKLPLKPDPTLKIFISAEHPLEGSLKFLKFDSNRTAEFIQFLLETNLHEQYGPNKTKSINATGGGAYKYSQLVNDKLGITFNQRDEMKCLIKGLNFLLLHVDNEAFIYNWREEKQYFISRTTELRNNAHFPFPYLLVNIGSGVSVLKVDGENSFERISGTSLGGGTFWGLCRMLANLNSFDEVKEMSKKGDNKNVDLLVGDIYGSDYHALGLKAEVIASSLGKLATTREDLHPSPQRPEDIVKSLLFMISNNIAQIGYLNARIYGVQRIFFSGGFLQENSYVWGRFSYAVDFWSKGEMKAMFLLHNSYLGALGALLEGHQTSSIPGESIG